MVSTRAACGGSWRSPSARRSPGGRPDVDRWMTVPRADCPYGTYCAVGSVRNKRLRIRERTSTLMCNQALHMRRHYMEFGTIEREVHIDASPEVVFDVISSPEHIRDWWNADTAIEPVVGSTSELTWRDEASGRVDVVPITVVDVRPPHVFSFRWTQEH